MTFLTIKASSSCPSSDCVKRNEHGEYTQYMNMCSVQCKWVYVYRIHAWCIVWPHTLWKWPYIAVASALDEDSVRSLVRLFGRPHYKHTNCHHIYGILLVLWAKWSKLNTKVIHFVRLQLYGFQYGQCASSKQNHNEKNKNKYKKRNHNSGNDDDDDDDDGQWCCCDTEHWTNEHSEWKGTCHRNGNSKTEKDRDVGQELWLLLLLLFLISAKWINLFNL